jgi:nitric oxide reductase subunit B
MSLLPQGLWQIYYSISHYYAYARSAEFMHSAVMKGLVWPRVTGDIAFSNGVFALVASVFHAFTRSHPIRNVT